MYTMKQLNQHNLKIKQAIHHILCFWQLFQAGKSMFCIKLKKMQHNLELYIRYTQIRTEHKQILEHTPRSGRTHNKILEDTLDPVEHNNKSFLASQGTELYMQIRHINTTKIACKPRIPSGSRRSGHGGGRRRAGLTGTTNTSELRPLASTRVNGEDVARIIPSHNAIQKMASFRGGDKVSFPGTRMSIRGWRLSSGVRQDQSCWSLFIQESLVGFASDGP